MASTPSVALVTGASRGIGRAVVEQLAAQGTRVWAVARDAAALHAAFQGRFEGRVTPVVADVNDTQRLVETLRGLDQQQPIEVVVANAGVGAASGHPSFSWETMAAALHTNFCGAAATLTALLPAMVQRQRGHVVFVSSLSSISALPQAEAYCVPKAGINMLMDCLRLDLEGTGVHATTVRLGFVRTAMLNEAAHALPGLVEPEAAARVIVDALGHPSRVIDFPTSISVAAHLGVLAPPTLKRWLTRPKGPSK